MRCAVALLIALAALECRAASFTFQRFGPGNIFALYLTGAELNGKFETIGFSATAAAPQEFINIGSGLSAGQPRPAGDPFTYRNRALDQDPVEGGQGWSFVGANPPIASHSIHWAGSPLGRTIDTSTQPDGKLFLMNLMLSQPVPFGVSVAPLELYRAGDLVAQLPMVPEPSAFGLATAGVVLALRRRRRWPAAGRYSRAAGHELPRTIGSAIGPISGAVSSS